LNVRFDEPSGPLRVDLRLIAIATGFGRFGTFVSERQILNNQVTVTFVSVANEYLKSPARLPLHSTKKVQLLTINDFARRLRTAAAVLLLEQNMSESLRGL
jgi:hypothetical protein